MSYTHFLFTSLPRPERAVIKVDGNLAEIDTWYAKELDVVVEKANINDFSEPLDTFGYKVKNADDLISNESMVTINSLPDKSVPTTGSTSTETIEDTPILLSDIIAISNSVDRLEVVSFEGFGNVLFNQNTIYPEQIIFRIDFDKVVFSVLEDFVMDDYFEFKYKVGNADGIDPTEYTITFDRDGLTEIETLSETINEDDQKYIYEHIIEIKKINPEAVHDFSVVITENTGTIAGLDENSEISLILNTEEDDDIQITDNIGLVFSTDQGYNIFKFRAQIIKTDTPIDIEFLISLSSSSNNAVGANHQINIKLALPPVIPE